MKDLFVLSVFEEQISPLEERQEADKKATTGHPNIGLDVNRRNQLLKAHWNGVCSYIDSYANNGCRICSPGRGGFQQDSCYFFPSQQHIIRPLYFRGQRFRLACACRNLLESPHKRDGCHVRKQRPMHRCLARP